MRRQQFARGVLEPVRPSVSQIIPSAVFDYDASILASYPGNGQAFKNLVNNPADGAAMSDYDMYLGTDGSAESIDPKFYGGLPGRRGGNLRFDGDDYAQLVGSNTGFLDDLHDTTAAQDFTIFMLMRHVNGTYNFCGTAQAAGSHGVIFYTLTGNDYLYCTARGSTNQTVNSGVAINQNAWNIIGMSHSYSNNNTRFWINSATAINAAHTFSADTTAATGKFTLFSYPDGTVPAPNGARWSSLFMFNEYFDDDKASKLIRFIQRRHRRHV